MISENNLHGVGKNNYSAEAVSDTLSTAVIVMDMDLRIMSMNAAAENLFGSRASAFYINLIRLYFYEKMIKDHLEFVIKNWNCRHCAAVIYVANSRIVSP